MYQQDTGFPLFLRLEPPPLYTKSWDSFFLKTYRRNITDNTQWPEPPPGDWWTPENGWLSRVNDLVRTIFVVKYLDGVEFLSNNMLKHFSQLGQRARIDMEAKDVGYYAAHVYTTTTFEVPRLNWDTETLEIQIEFQISTQIQEVIRQLLHRYYETNRIRQAPPVKWQWDYRSEEFVPNYLGHILHYLEGMIMEVRSRQYRSKGT